MPAGKLASQASHASCQSLIKYLIRNPSELERFDREGHSGSRIIISAKNTTKLLAAFEQAKAADLPCAVFEDEGHVLLPHFTGAPVLTALAIGPAPRAAMREITKRFKCVR